MKNISKIPFELLRVDGLKEILAQVNASCKNQGIEFFIIGAIARNAWYVAHNQPVEGTKDIDVAVYIPKSEEYNQLRHELKSVFGYIESPENAFCFVSPNGKPIDLLPFGAIEKEKRIKIEGKGWIEIDLEGFSDVFRHGLEKVIFGTEEYWICNIPSIVILKLIAYDDRPEHRIKDLKDINTICSYFPDIERERIWSDHFDLYENDRTHQEIAMTVLGREMKKITQYNVHLHQRLIKILNRAIDLESELARHLIQDSEKETLEEKQQILIQIQNGLTE